MPSDIFVKSFTHLRDRPKAERALPMLQRIASLVKPIMRKHGWYLPLLAEFFPQESNLVGLNVNMGQKILLRLRPAWAPDTFYEEEQVVAVMLHELTHNVHGPHDEKFYKYLSGLEDEYDALKRSGYSGEGFFSEGRRLGTNVSHNLPPHLARLKGLEAAEKRRQLAGVMNGSGRRLGGRGIPIKNLSPRELAAQAAERRAHDEKACGSGAVAQREADKAAKESVEDQVIDLTGDDSDNVTPVNARYKSAASQPKNRSLSTVIPSSASAQDTASRSTSNSRVPPVPNYNTKPIKQSMAEWSCLSCTLINGPFALQCSACLANRPPNRMDGWICMTCGETDMPWEYWSCRFCGTVKTQS